MLNKPFYEGGGAYEVLEKKIEVWFDCSINFEPGKT